MTVNHAVAGSSPACGVFLYQGAVLAQSVERFHGKEEVAGSTPANGFSNYIGRNIEGTLFVGVPFFVCAQHG